MNVTVENLAPCKKLVRVEVDAKAVDEAFESTAKEYQKQVSLPGFRPGKAPRDMVVRKYEKGIEDEVRRKLISESYRAAIKEKNLVVVTSPDIEEIQFGRGKAMQFAATIETAPEFEMPEYKGLPAKREEKSVTDEDVERALNLLREQRCSFNTAPRELKRGDVAVVNYTGTCEGQPILNIAPTAKGLAEKKNFWIGAEPTSFIPGFADQLLGARAGDRRAVSVDFPPDFVTKELAGKKGVYDVEVVEIKEKSLPALDDAFAKSFEAESMEKLRAGVRRDLENELNYSQSKQLRAQVVRALLNQANFDLPETTLAEETRNVVYDIVGDNTKRGVSREIIEKEKDSIYSAATNSAKDRVKLAFLVSRIADKEGIKATKEEILSRIATLAAAYEIAPEKFIKELEKRNGVTEIYNQIVHEKVLDFVQSRAKIESVPAGYFAQSSPPPPPG